MFGITWWTYPFPFFVNGDPQGDGINWEWPEGFWDSEAINSQEDVEEKDYYKEATPIEEPIDDLKSVLESWKNSEKVFETILTKDEDVTPFDMNAF